MNTWNCMGASWSLMVFEDGTRAQYLSEKLFDEIKKDKSNNAMTQEELTKNGMTAVGNLLKDVIHIGSNEQLIPFYSYQDKIGVQPEGSSEMEWTVIGNIIVFSRTVDGIHVLGKGSKISIELSNSGEIVNFAYDWPRYETIGDYQQQVDFDTVMERVSTFNTVDIYDPGEKEAEVSRFECGYWDIGSRRDVMAPIQTACVVFTEVRVGNGDKKIRYKTMDAIPAGLDVELDEEWPQALALVEGGDYCFESSASDAFLELDIDYK